MATNPPPHPADGIADDLIEKVKGLFNGDNIRQTVHEAWDRMNAPTPQPEENDTVKQMNKDAMDKQAQDVAQSYRDQAAKDALSETAAAKIRAKAKAKLGGK